MKILFNGDYCTTTMLVKIISFLTVKKESYFVFEDDTFMNELKAEKNDFMLIYKSVYIRYRVKISEWFPNSTYTPNTFFQC